MNRWFDKFPILSKYLPGKIILSFLMLLLSFILMCVFQTFDRFFCFLALICSVFGDLFLNYFPENRPFRKSDLMAGGIFFIFAHFLFFKAYYEKILMNGFTIINAGFVFAIILLVVTSIAFIIKAGENRRSFMLYFALIYLWLTGIDYLIIFSYSYSIKSIESLALLGGLLFLASDIIIGCEQFLGLKSKLCRELVWWFYPIGQIIMIIMA